MRCDQKAASVLTIGQIIISVVYTAYHWEWRNAEHPDEHGPEWLQKEYRDTVRLEYWLIGYCVQMALLQMIVICLVPNSRYSTTWRRRMYKYPISVILCLWAFFSHRLISQCDACHDVNNEHYVFCYWCCIMMASTLLYHFIPESAAVMIMVLLITMTPLLLVLKCFGVPLRATSMWCFGLSPAELLGDDAFDDDTFNARFDERRDERTDDDPNGDVVQRLNALRITAVPDMSRLPIVDASQTNVVRDGEECPICLAKYKEEDRMFLLPCMHRFHVDCVASWIFKTNSCPMCRSHVLPTHTRSVFVVR